MMRECNLSPHNALLVIVVLMQLDHFMIIKFYASIVEVLSVISVFFFFCIFIFCLTLSITLV